MVVLGEKLGWVLWATSLGWEVELGAPFLVSSRIHPSMLGQRERLPRTRTTRRKRTSGVRGLIQKAYVSYVSGLPCRVYIDLNHRDSRI
jgi:hypothetical protein